MTIFDICQFLGGATVIWIENGRYSVFQSPNRDVKIQFLMENTTVMVFIQKFDYGITIIFEKINGDTVIQNLVRRPPSPPKRGPHISLICIRVTIRNSHDRKRYS